MITLKPYSGGLDERCVRCGSDVLIQGDPEDLQGWGRLPDAMQSPNGFLAECGVSACGDCARAHFFFSLAMCRGDVDAKFRRDYLEMESDSFDWGAGRRYEAARGPERWFVVRHDTPAGPLLFHFFPSLPADAAYSFKDHVAFCRQFLIERWAELRQMVEMA